MSVDTVFRGLAHATSLLLGAPGAEDGVISRRDADNRVADLKVRYRGLEALAVRSLFDRADQLDDGLGARVTAADLGRIAAPLREHLAAVDPFGNGLDRGDVLGLLNPEARAWFALGRAIESGVVDAPALGPEVLGRGAPDPTVGALFQAFASTLALDEHGVACAEVSWGGRWTPYEAGRLHRLLVGRPADPPYREGWPSRAFFYLERTFGYPESDDQTGERVGAWDALVEALVSENQGAEVSVFVSAGPWAGPDEGARVLWVLPRVERAYLHDLMV